MRQAKKPETKERQNASTPPSKWTCPREQTPATANTSYAVPQRRSRRRLAGSPKPPMESRQANSIHGVALSKASSRPRCATRSIPTPRCRACPARNAVQICPQRPAPRPPRPWHQHEADPGAKKQKYAQNCNFFAIADCRRRQNVDWSPEKRQIGRTAAHFRLAEDGKESAIAKKLHRSRNFCFCETDRRNGAILAKDTCAFNANQAEQQHGTTAHRPYKHSCPHPWQRSRASSTEKCNIWRETMGKISQYSRKLLKASSLQSFEGRTWGSIVNNWSNTTSDCYKKQC